ncbi:MAG: leucine-rich repeat domain-containing protein [Solobacterium sp.]|nr:leucine-rich repeat domain-containing protein [Solobacterium sp.]
MYGRDSEYFVIDENGVLTEYKGNDTVIVLPPEVKVIGPKVFSGYKGYGAVRGMFVPEGVTEIGKDAFLKSRIEAVILPSTLNKIGESAFGSCAGLRSVTIPDGVTEIAESTFMFSGLEEIILPEHLAKIGKDAFFRCIYLKKIDLPETHSLEIGKRAFGGCAGLADESGMLIIQNRLFGFYPDKYYPVDVNIPDNVTYIEDDVFISFPRINITMSLNCPSWTVYKDPHGFNILKTIIRDDGCSLTFRDAGGKTAAKIPALINGEYRNVSEEFLLSIRCRQTGGFDFDAYDRMFAKLTKEQNKIMMAAVRLLYPYGLSKEMEAEYTSFLRRKENAVCRELIDKKRIRPDDMDVFKVLKQYRLICAEDTAYYIGYAQKKEKYELVSELLDYQKNAFGTEDVYQSMELPEDTGGDDSDNK